MKNNMIGIKLTKEEMIGRIHKCVENEKKIMRSDLVNKYEDIVGEKIANLAVEASCECIDAVGMQLVEHINMLSNSKFVTLNADGKIRLVTFIITECDYFNNIIKEETDNEDRKIEELLELFAFVSASYKILQCLAETMLEELTSKEERIMADSLIEMLEHNAVALIKKATEIRKKHLFAKIIKSLI